MFKIIRSGNDNRHMIFNEINIQWAITRRCNYMCDFCGVYDNNQSELSLNQNINIAKTLSDIFPEKHRTYVIIGGEPTLYDGYEKLVFELLQNITSNDTICIFSNGSENWDKFKYNVSIGLYENVVPLFTFHSAKDTGQLKKKIQYLVDNDITFKVNMMIYPGNLNVVQKFYNNFAIAHNEKFIFECVPIEQMNLNEYPEYKIFAEIVNKKKLGETHMNVFYDIYDDDSHIIKTETYTQSTLKLLDKKYFNFQGFKCYSRYRLSIDSDGEIYDFCDRCFGRDRPLGNVLDMNNVELEKLISKYRICVNKQCPICDTSLLYKERLNLKKYGIES